MGKKAELHYEGKVYEIPVVTGTENENALDISKLRGQSGLITLDRGFKNTGSTESAITFLNGEEGILRYRGYSIEELAEKSSFLEVSFLLIYGELPTKTELAKFNLRWLSFKGASNGSAFFISFCFNCFLSKIFRS
jgi:citrate synthase